MRRLWIGLIAPVLLGAAGEPAKDWQPVHSKEGGFQVEMPGKPIESRQIVKTGLGNLDVTMLLLEQKKEGAFVVSFANFPESAVKGTADQRLDFARDGAVAAAKGKLKSEKKIAIDKYPGRELLIEGKDKSTVRTRIYAVDNKLFQTLVSGPATWVQGKEAERFLGSFQLK